MPELGATLPRELEELGEHLRKMQGAHALYTPPETSWIKRGVHRVVLRTSGGRRSLVIKGVDQDAARKTEQLVTDWLPAVGLEDCGPPVLRTIPSADPRRAWLILGDLGPEDLSHHLRDADRVRATARQLAQMHDWFRGHSILADCRIAAGDRGAQYFLTNVGDAIDALRSIPQPLEREEERSIRRLLERLNDIGADATRRLDALREHGGDDTLVHGDVWPENVFVDRRDDEWRVRFVDWDRMGVGPAVYDLSAFTSRLPPEIRNIGLATYRESCAIDLPDDGLLAELFRTMEYSRLANCVIWASRVMAETNSRWAVEDLVTIEQWFATLEEES